jgi:hypothetical protein
MDEAITIKLTAQDNASAVLKSMSGNAKTAAVDIEKIGEKSARAGDAVQKFANVLGAGWITDSAAQLKELAEASKGAAAALKSGGPGALALKAGLVGLAAIVGYKIGETIAGWVFETKRFSKELGEAAAKARELGDIQSRQSTSRIDQEIADLKEFGGTFEQQMTAAQDMASRIAKEIAGKGGQEELAKSQLEKLEGQRKYFLASQEEVDSAKANLEIIQEQKKALQEKLSLVQQEFSEAELFRQKKREAIAQEKAAEQERASAAIDAERERTKMAEDRAKAEEQRIKNEEKLREQAFKKQQAAEIKASADSVKGLESEISDLESMKLDTSRPTLASKDERMTSLARGSGDIQQQQLEQSKRQVKLAELNQKLMQENARYLKLLAEKEETVISIGGG